MRGRAPRTVNWQGGTRRNCSRSSKSWPGLRRPDPNFDLSVSWLSPAGPPTRCRALGQSKIAPLERAPISFGPNRPWAKPPLGQSALGQSALGQSALGQKKRPWAKEAPLGKRASARAGPAQPRGKPQRAPGQAPASKTQPRVQMECSTDASKRLPRRPRGARTRPKEPARARARHPGCLKVCGQRAA